MPFELPTGRTAVMGVLNVTPDSFSDGGMYLDPDAAIARGIEMWEEGADLVDVGGESTRPGALEVSAQIEAQRVLPVIKGLLAGGVAVSIDSWKSEVVERALDAGAQVANNVRGVQDDACASLCASFGTTLCIMHMKGDPRTMQMDPRYGDVVGEVKAELAAASTRAEAAGVKREQIWLDPGIGFGKDLGHNLALLNRLDEIAALGYPVLVGVSRKSFIGRILGSDGQPLPVEDRLEGTLAAQSVAQMKGARILRAHDVRATKRAAAVVDAVLSGR